ncbi:type II secretion system protein N [Jeongeupia sp. USM3]|uniref:type II secretion system protein N n=1 Tax=Jeongeupia sp. USM3 TaxID=1906741 RepID=UPI00089DF64F|nr:type II secretion system protein N [Jeongeupia sp. USM3]AOX99782.1 hypothetical protein BJP62_04505 [Jeongeupia sp. USM3]
MKPLGNRRLLIVFSACLAAAVIGRLPASLFAGLVPAPLQLGSVSGTLWSGRAAQVGINGQELVRGLSWQWRPAALLRGELGWSLRGDPATPLSAELHAGPTGIGLRNFDARLPAAPLLALAKPLAPFQLGGTLAIRAGEIGRDALSAAQVQWLDASSPITPQANPFGSYKLDLSRDGQRLNWRMAPLGGRLDVAGDGSVGPAGPQGTLTLRPADGQAALFAPLLDRLPGDARARTLQLGAP